MIQRIQTIYLIIALLIGVFSFAVPLFYVDAVSVNLAQGLKGISYASLPATIAILTLFVALLGIFLYKRRNMQAKWVQLGILLSLILLVIIFGFPESVFLLPEGVELNYGAGGYLLLLQPIAFILAIRGIKKDEKMVRAADRLR